MKWLELSMPIFLASALACSGAAQPSAAAPGAAPATAAIATPASPPLARRGCARAVLLAVPDDYAARGPWPVGVVTVEHDERLVEVWYPALSGAEHDAARERYDLRRHLPAAEAGKIPDHANPLQDCNCYRDLPLDRDHGPYPIVLFLHGAGSFRTQNAALATHWASRGMVVVAPDLPAVNLRSALGDFDFGNPFARAGEVLTAASSASSGFATFSGQLQSDRIAIVGHSFGGGIAERLRDEPGVVAIVAISSGGVKAGVRTISTTIIGGTHDGVVPYSRQQAGYAASPAPARLLGVAGAGHISFTDLCEIGRDAGGLLAIASRHGVEVPAMISRLGEDGCRADDLASAEALPLISFASAAALEESLHCDERAGAALRAIADRYPAVVEFADKTEPE